MTYMRGIYAIPVTPFEHSLALDRRSLIKTIEFCIDSGADGIVTPVNASEGPYLTDTERNDVIKLAAVTINRTVPFVAGVSGNSIYHAAELTDRALALGASSVIAMPPHNASESYIYDYFATIAQAASGKPVWIQNNKPPACPTIPTHLIVRILQEIDGVEWIKEESAYPGQVMSRILDEAGKNVKGIMGGMGGRFLLDEYSRGACGSMPSGHITDAYTKLWAALESGSRWQTKQVVSDEARAIWERMAPILNFEFMFGVAAYKAVFYKRGIIETTLTRSPLLRAMDKQDMHELEAILNRISDLLA